MHSCPEYRSSVRVNMKHSEVLEIPPEYFPGSFRAKLNSRFHRRASVFATAVIALHPSFLALSPLLAYAYSTSLMYS